MKSVGKVSLDNHGMPPCSLEEHFYVKHGDGSVKENGMQSLVDGEFKRERVIQQLNCKIDDRDEAQLLVSRQHDTHRVTVTIRAGSVLDLRIFDLMQRAITFAKAYKAVRMIIDLGSTRRIQDSGHASLLLLKQDLGGQIETVKLVNAGHLMYANFDYLAGTFEIN